MKNEKIADIFEEMSTIFDMMDVQFKPRAYEKAADEIRAYGDDVKELYRKGGIQALEEIPFIGKGMAEKIEEYIKTGSIKEYVTLKKKYPIKLKELMAIEGVGPKMIRTLHRKLHIKNLDDLERAIKNHAIRSIPHLGEKTEKNIARGIAFLRQTGNRKILGYVLPLARIIEARLRGVKGVTHAVIAGSIRRRQETIGDIDILVTTSTPQNVVNTFISMPEVVAIHSHGSTRASVRLINDMDADIRMVPENSFGAALQYFTGDKAHNIALRERAIKRGMKLSEYGLFKGKRVIASKKEEDVYTALGLEYIEPELRTHSGEIEAAETDTLPKIIPYGCVRGDLQVQTEWTDGVGSIRDLADKALLLGREYIAITDHTKSLAMTGGLDGKKLTQQGKEIDALNKEFKAKRKQFILLKGAEVNILKDGSLDISDNILAKLDVVGVSIHSHFKMTQKEMTHRIIRTFKNPHVDIFFHPTGRLIHQRPPYDVDMEQIIKAAVQYRVALEINAYPDRSDLRDEYVRLAVAHNAKMVINTDAHTQEQLAYIELGEAIARRGWAEKKHILNTLPVERLLAFFNTKK